MVFEILTRGDLEKVERNLERTENHLIIELKLETRKRSKKKGAGAPYNFYRCSMPVLLLFVLIKRDRSDLIVKSTN